jgi:hypothetical protein
MRAIDYSQLTERRCSKCKAVKPVAEFHRYNDPTAAINGWRYHTRCKSCSNAAAQQYGQDNRPRRNDRLKRWRKSNPDAARAKDQRARVRAYGIEPADVERMTAEQDGKCALCRRKKRLVIDHCHRTGRVRGLLCHQCNTGLGWIEGNPDVLARIAGYTADQLCHVDTVLEVANV